MLYKPHENFSINLAKAPLIQFFQRTEKDAPEMYDLSLGGVGTKMSFTPADIAQLRETLGEYNEKHSGHYYWLFPNVAINLDVISGVLVHEKRIFVMYPGGETTLYVTSGLPAHDIYARYIKHAESLQQKKALDIKAMTDWDFDAEKKAFVPRPANFGKTTAPVLPPPPPAPPGGKKP